MVFVIFKCSLRILVGITVFTAIHAGIIRPDIPAFDTVTALPHPLVLPILEHNTILSFFCEIFNSLIFDFDISC